MNVFATWTIYLAAASLCVSSATAHATETLASDSQTIPSPSYPVSCLATGDQVVLVSTRHLPCVPGRTLDLDTFTGSLLDPCGRLLQQDVSLLEPNEFVETWVLMHGNQITPQMAVERGTRIYRSLRRCSANTGPIRFVIWSWPSERTTNRIADARVKSRRTDAESFYFGSFLTGITGNGPVSILGYSFGARVVSGGMHLAEGGRPVASTFLASGLRWSPTVWYFSLQPSKTMASCPVAAIKCRCETQNRCCYKTIRRTKRYASFG